MRLIDADKLKREEIVSLEYGTFKPTDGEIVDGKTIDNAPTIDAVPVEWLDNWGRRNTFFYGDKYNVITMLLREWRCKQRVKQANKMLEDWEKENGRSE